MPVKRILLMNGPNLDMLGVREPEVYGSATLRDLEEKATTYAQSKDVALFCFQSNSEAELIDKIHGTRGVFDGIVYNPGAHTHYSYALRDAIGGIDLTVNEVNYNYFYDWDGIEGLTQAEACNGSHTVHLNGDQALMYARTRKGDRVENGDFGRTLHQRDFLSQFVNNCKDASIGELDSVLKTLLPYIVTDMARSDLENHVYDLMEYVSYDMSDARVPCAGSWEYYKTPKGAEVVNINVPANAAYVKAKIYG